MADVLERPGRVSFFRRPFVGGVIAAVLAFGASSGLPHRTLSHLVSTTFGIAMVLLAIAPALREVSDSAMKWTMVAGSLVAGAGLGLFIQFVFR